MSDSVYTWLDWVCIYMALYKTLRHVLFCTYPVHTPVLGSGKRFAAVFREPDLQKSSDLAFKIKL